MACARYRSDTKRWGVDYKDSYGKRRWITCESRQEAQILVAEKMRKPGGDPNSTFEEIATRWLNITRASVRPQSWAHYEANLRIHILPVLKDIKLARINSGMLLEFLSGKKEAEGLAPKTVGHLQSTLYAVFQHAVKHEGLPANPAAGLAKEMNIKRLSREGPVKAFTECQLAKFMVTAQAMAADIYPLFFAMGRTGPRISEATALIWPELDFDKRAINIARTWVGTRLQEVPKTANSCRKLDMSLQLRDTLVRWKTEQKRKKLALGWAEVPRWVFCSSNGKPLCSRSYVSGRFKQILEASELPLHFTPHSLRHTFACLHLQKGVNPVYVQKQLGHSSIQMTVDLYGSWFPISDKAAADALDDVHRGKLW